MTVLVALRHRPESDRSDYRSANPGFILVSIGRLSPYFITHSVVAWQLANLWYFRYAIFPYEVSLSGKPDDDGHMGHAHCLPKQIYYVAATDAQFFSAFAQKSSRSFSDEVFRMMISATLCTRLISWAVSITQFQPSEANKSKRLYAQV